MPDSERNGNGIWKIVAIAQTSIIVTGITAWIGFGSALTRAEVVEEINERMANSLYAKEREFIRSSIEDNRRLATRFETILQSQADISADLRVIKLKLQIKETSP